MIEGEIATLLQSGCSLTVGTVDSTGVPTATRAFGLLVLPGGDQLRLLVTSTCGNTLDNLRTTTAIAVTGTVVETFQSVQVKGRATAVEAETDEDRERFETYVAAFFRAIEKSDGTPIELLERLRPAERIAVVMTVDAMFDQTPGPHAGRRLAGAGA